MLPSVASLQALRQHAKGTRATKALIAFGNPLLDGPDSRYETRAKLARERGQCPKTARQRLAGAPSSRRESTRAARRSC